MIMIFIIYSKLAQREYKIGDDKVCEVIHWESVQEV